LLFEFDHMYKPDLADYCDLLREYGTSGILHYKDLKPGLRARLEMSIPARLLETDEYRIEQKFAAAKKRDSKPFNLIPMPQPIGPGVDAAFFIPRFRFNDPNSFSCAFCLILWINGGVPKTMAFRIEPPDPPGVDAATGLQNSDAHQYSHIQISRKVREPDYATSIDDWTPESYPAFPLFNPTPLRLFLTTIVSIHGYDPAHQHRFIFSALGRAGAARARRLQIEVAESLAPA
jgi:hypothetical protein